MATQTHRTLSLKQRPPMAMKIQDKLNTCGLFEKQILKLKLLKS